MNKEALQRIIEELNLDNKIYLDDVPELDLYMDQVIQLFESKLSPTKRYEEDKVLTKTMINNYAKAKLLMTIKNKKYSKEHLILMSLIYDLKGSLSINDIKVTLDNIVQSFEKGEGYPLRELYSTYLEIYKRDVEDFKKDVLEKQDEITKSVEFTKGDKNYEEKFLMISSLITMSNLYRRMSEKLIDEFFIKGDGIDED